MNMTINDDIYSLLNLIPLSKGCLLLLMVFLLALKSMRLGLKTLVDFPRILSETRVQMVI
jgi:hypothetical protein